MPEPIKNLLKSEKQRELAELQDAVVAAIYDIDRNTVLHGGTAIWRCYGSKRFSEDVDIYLTDEQANLFGKELTWSLSRHGVKMEYPKLGARRIEVFNDFARTKLESMKSVGKLHPVQKEYETVDGSKLFVKTLSIDEFIKEKIETYSRRHYTRDLYDIYQLASLGKPTAKTKKALISFLSAVEKPTDKQRLEELVYTGIAPDFQTMIKSIEEGLK